MSTMCSLRSIAMLSLLLCGCWFDRGQHMQACVGDSDCDSGFYCYQSFCIEGTGRSGEPCGQVSQIESCYEGDEATRDVGACASGQRFCANGTYSECLGQVLPALNEVCNGKDDDCNMRVDDVAAASTCTTPLQGACAEGALACRDGVEVCQPLRQSQTEVCNAIDDDCDGTVDEVPLVACYPNGSEGCALDSESSWQCQGLCATGLVECDAGGETCRGAITPTNDVCARGAAFAQDEDCDGQIDEGCNCSDGTPRDCYAGPIGTSGHGGCRAGTQTCDGIEWGPCMNQVLPSAETCENQGTDDDCNDVMDDVPGVDAACIATGARGECRNGTMDCVPGVAAPECVGSAPSFELCDDLDQDCNGDPTNGYDFTSNATCGSCDERCSFFSQTCCNSQCIPISNLQRDEQNCGACGRACGAGQYCCQGDCLSIATQDMAACNCSNTCGDRSCCDTTCLDLRNDPDNCGACGLKCSRNDSCSNGVCN